MNARPDPVRPDRALPGHVFHGHGYLGASCAGLPQASPCEAGQGAETHPAQNGIVMGFVTLALLIAGVGTWAATSKITGAVVAPGQVEVERNRQVVQHPDGGVVAAIDVRDGDRVEAGQVLIRLEDALLRPERAVVEGQLRELAARRDRLEAERDDRPAIRFSADLVRAAAADADTAALMAGQRGLFAARRETLRKALDQIDRRRDQTRAQIGEIDAQIDAIGRQRILIERELSDQQGLLDKGLAQAARVLALRREAADLDGRAGELIAERAQSEGRIAELELESLRQTSQRREEAETDLRDIGPKQLELTERLRILTGQIDRLDLRAPVGGRVYGLAVTTPRAVLRGAEPALFIVPDDRPLLIVARIAPTRIDEIRPGLPVTLRFPAFSGRMTPELAGRLERISADVITDEAARTSYYRAEVSIPETEEVRLGGRALLPGMPAEVLIRTGKRSPLVYLIKPFADYFARAFRED